MPEGRPGQNASKKRAFREMTPSPPPSQAERSASSTPDSPPTATEPDQSKPLMPENTNAPGSERPQRLLSEAPPARSSPKPVLGSGTLIEEPEESPFYYHMDDDQLKALLEWDSKPFSDKPTTLEELKAIPQCEWRDDLIKIREEREAREAEEKAHPWVPMKPMFTRFRHERPDLDGPTFRHRLREAGKRLEASGKDPFAHRKTTEAARAALAAESASGTPPPAAAGDDEPPRKKAKHGQVESKAVEFGFSKTLEFPKDVNAPAGSLPSLLPPAPTGSAPSGRVPKGKAPKGSIPRIRGRRIKPDTVPFMKMSLQRAYDLMLLASQTYIGKIRIHMRRMHVTPPLRHEFQQDETVAMALYSRGQPTDSLAANVSLIKSIWWQRGVATRLLDGGSETAAMERMKRLQTITDRICEWTRGDRLESRGGLKEAYVSFHMDAVKFLTLLENDEYIELLDTMVEKREEGKKEFQLSGNFLLG